MHTCVHVKCSYVCMCIIIVKLSSTTYSDIMVIQNVYIVAQVYGLWQSGIYCSGQEIINIVSYFELYVYCQEYVYIAFVLVYY